MELSLGIAVGSATQIALFVVPMCVVIAWCAAHPPATRAPPRACHRVTATARPPSLSLRPHPPPPSTSVTQVVRPAVIDGLPPVRIHHAPHDHPPRWCHHTDGRVALALRHHPLYGLCETRTLSHHLPRSPGFSRLPTPSHRWSCLLASSSMSTWRRRARVRERRARVVCARSHGPKPAGPSAAGRRPQRKRALGGAIARAAASV